MHLFLFGLALLFIGYYVYGKFIERILGPDDRPTPALTKRDGVDYLVLPQWKNALIQLLNIAGIGPVIGVILGIKFGSIVFLIIPVGCVLGGAVHDFVAGMMSIRSGGVNLPTLVRENLGRTAMAILAVFMTFLLILVVTVFINVPASLANGLLMSPPAQTESVAASPVEGGEEAVSDMADGNANLLMKWSAGLVNRLGFSDVKPSEIHFFWLVVVAIFLYYIVATLFPVDAIIGRFYPFFGGILLVGTVAVFGAVLLFGNVDPDFLVETKPFQEIAAKMPPIIPCLFVTIACGILSGFHATQAPIIARTMASEREARFNFYGMMIAEGAIAMVWAAGALAIYNLFPEFLTRSGTDTLSKITTFFLGGGLGGVTILAVIVLAITSGDTALRCLRLTIEELLHLRKKTVVSRLLIVIPLILIISVLLFWSNGSPKSFNELWNYFAWGNQVLAASTLMTATVWLRKQGKNHWITFLPGLFMTFVVLSFILWTSKANGPVGCGLPLNTAYLIAGAVTLVIGVVILAVGKKAARTLPSTAAVTGEEAGKIA